MKTSDALMTGLNHVFGTIAGGVAGAIGGMFRLGAMGGAYGLLGVVPWCSAGAIVLILLLSIKSMGIVLLIALAPVIIGFALGAVGGFFYGLVRGMIDGAVGGLTGFSLSWFNPLRENECTKDIAKPSNSSSIKHIRLPPSSNSQQQPEQQNLPTEGRSQSLSFSTPNVTTEEASISQTRSLSSPRV